MRSTQTAPAFHGDRSTAHPPQCRREVGRDTTAETAKLARDYARDCESVSAKNDGLPDDRRIASETALPHSPPEDRGGPPVARVKRSPPNRSAHPQQRKVI